MDNVTPAALVGIILAVAGAISTLGGAANWLVKLVQVVKAPNTRQDERLQALEDWRKGVDQSLARDLSRFEALDEGERVTQRALLALLDHGIDGNNIEQMQHAKEALQSHLINR